MRTGKENLNFCSFLHVADKSLRNLSAIFGILQEFMCGKRGKSAKNIIASSKKEMFEKRTPSVAYMLVVTLIPIFLQNKIILALYRILQVNKKN